MMRRHEVGSLLIYLKRYILVKFTDWNIVGIFYVRKAFIVPPKGGGMEILYEEAFLWKKNNKF